MSDILHDEETLVHETKPSRWHFWPGYLISASASMFFPPAVIIFGFIELYRNSTKYFVTDQRVIKVFDFLHKNVDSVRYDSVTDLHVKQDFVQRVARIGSLSVNTSGQLFKELKFIGVKNPDKVENLVQKHIYRYRQRLYNPSLQKKWEEKDKKEKKKRDENKGWIF